MHGRSAMLCYLRWMPARAVASARWLVVCSQRCGVQKDAAPEGAYCGFRPVHALLKRISTGVRDHAGKARAKHTNFVRHPRLPSVLSPGGTCPWVADNHGGLEITITMM